MPASADQFRIVVELPPDRNYPGTIRVEDNFGNVLVGPFPALGRAANTFNGVPNTNATRDPLQQNGNTPLGSYSAEGLIPTGAGTSYPSSSYGASGAVRMTPTSGQALAASQAGRFGLLIHSGHTMPNGSLMPTAGCIRVYEQDLQQVIEAIQTSGGFPVQCDGRATIEVIPESTRMCGTNSPFDYPDPPSYFTPIHPPGSAPGPPAAPPGPAPSNPGPAPTPPTHTHEPHEPIDHHPFDPEPHQPAHTPEPEHHEAPPAPHEPEHDDHNDAPDHDEGDVPIHLG